MLEEIRQQPASLARTLAAEARHIEQFKRAIARRRPKLIVLAARGTSDNAANFGRYLLEITTGIPVSLAAPSIYTLYNAAVDFPPDATAGEPYELNPTELMRTTMLSSGNPAPWVARAISPDVIAPSARSRFLTASWRMILCASPAIT